MPEVAKEIRSLVKIAPATWALIQKKIKNVSDFKKEIENFLVKPVTELLEVILGGGVNLEASDIHIEPQEKEAKIRVRIDGILQDATSFDLKVYQGLLNRIKLLSGIKLNITDRPQDGRFSFLAREMPVEIRVSALPAEYGETIVLRILNPKGLIKLETLGLRGDLLGIFKTEIERPNGMIVVTGPTGCGKTTTLYAILKKIQKPEIKIITIEDPIEYHLKGVSQTQVNPKKGYDFANGLKSIMRQDPDVVLVGEIRDSETVRTALQAALTGHLVLTTLHTNDAAGTVARLTALGAEPSNVGPAINLVIAQRLVRKVCKKCSKSKLASILALNEIKKELKGIPKKIKIPKLKRGLRISQVEGCKYCNFTGHRGRTGIFEVFLVDEEMEKFILTLPSIASLRNKTIQKGMVTMKQDGLIKVIEGITTLEEVERVMGK